MMNERPLVSVAVITYNSEKYVLETLESVKSQTYKDIELIISDDCSSDRTLDVCKKWVESNRDRFVDVCVIVPPENTGIPANVNRAVQASNGIWFKAIAGDDVLINNAIEKYIGYVSMNKGANIVFAKEFAFYEEDGQVIEEPFGKVDKESIESYNNLTAREQYLLLLKDELKHFVLTPTCFVKKELLLLYPYNEKYKGFEDLPEWLILTKNGVHFSCMNDYTVKYRRGDSLTLSNNRLFSPIYWDSKHQFFWNELRDFLIEENLYDVYNKKRKELLKVDLLDCLTNNKSNLINKVKNVIISKIVDKLKFSKRG